jgi:hypothetical protein
MLHGSKGLQSLADKNQNDFKDFKLRLTFYNAKPFYTNDEFFRTKDALNRDNVNKFVWYGFTYNSDMRSLFCIDLKYVSL